MTDLNDLEKTAGAESTAAEEARGISLLREAEKAREEQSDTLFLDIPSWNGALVGEYKVVDRPRLEKMVRRIQKEARTGNQSNARTAADIDLILEANVGLYAVDVDLDDNNGRVALEDDIGVVTYGRFAPLLGRSDLSSGRQVVTHVFKNNAVAISAHALAIAKWMRDPSKDPLEGLE